MQRLTLTVVALAFVLCACTPPPKSAPAPTDDARLKVWCQANFRAPNVDALDLLVANPAYRSIMLKGTEPAPHRFVPAGMEQDADIVDRAMGSGDPTVLTAPETRAAAARLDAYATTSPQCASYTVGITPASRTRP